MRLQALALTSALLCSACAMLKPATPVACIEPAPAPASSEPAAQASAPSAAQSKPEASLPMSKTKLEARRWSAIGKFAERCQQRDTEAVLAMLVPKARAALGDDLWRKQLQTEIMPFFAKYKRLQNIKNIESGVLPNGRTAYRYYTYFIASDGRKVAFDIILTDEGNDTMVANIGHHGCVRGKHPIC